MSGSRLPIRYHDGGFPPPAVNWTELLPLIGPANAAIARYEWRNRTRLGALCRNRSSEGEEYANR